MTSQIRHGDGARWPLADERCAWDGRIGPNVVEGSGVIDGIRTRNNQNHNLGLYH